MWEPCNIWTAFVWSKFPLSDNYWQLFQRWKCSGKIGHNISHQGRPLSLYCSLGPQNLLVLWLKAYNLWQHLPISPTSQPLPTIILLSFSMSSAFLDSACEIIVCLCLTYFTLNNILKVYPYCCKLRISFFLMAK